MYSHGIAENLACVHCNAVWVINCLLHLGSWSCVTLAMHHVLSTVSLLLTKGHVMHVQEEVLAYFFTVLREEDESCINPSWWSMLVGLESAYILM